MENLIAFKMFIKSHPVPSLFLFFWVLCGLWHLFNLWFDSIYREVLENSYTMEAPTYQHWVVIPYFAKSWRIIAITALCLICGPFTRKAVGKVFGIKYDPDAGWEYM